MTDFPGAGGFRPGPPPPPEAEAGPLPPATPHARSAESLARLRRSARACWIRAALLAIAAAAAWLAWDAPWPLVGLALLASAALAAAGFAPRIESTLRCLVHENGLAMELGGQIQRRLFWRDVVNVIEDSDSGRLEVYSHDDRLSVPVRDLQAGEELRARVLTEWDNLWGYKTSTFRDLAYYYPPSVLAQYAEDVRIARALVGAGAGVGVAAAVTAGLQAAGVLSWGVWSWGLSGLFAAASGLALAGGVGDLARSRQRLERAQQVGGIQLGETSLKIISPSGSLREIPYSDLEELVAAAGSPIDVRVRGEGPFRIEREVAYFEKFRLWLIDLVREAGVPVRE